jgi:O-antigen/teichoic acid export membrane protein
MSARFVFGSTAAYLAVSVATMATSILLVPLMTRVLAPADYGVMLLVSNGSAIISFLLAFSLGQALPTLFSSTASEARRRALCTTLFVSIATIMLVAFGLAALFSRQIATAFTHRPDDAAAITWAAVWAYLNVCSLILVLIARTSERHTLYLTVQLPGLALQVILIVWLLLVEPMGLVGFYVATSISAAFTTVVYLFALRRWISGPYDPAQIVAASGIGAQMLPWQFATVVTTSSAAFFLTRGAGLEEAGLFSLANGAAGLLMAISNSFESAWSPFVLTRKDQPDLSNIQVRIFSLFSAALLVAASAISLFAHEIFILLAGPAFRDGYRLVPGLSLAFCIYAFAACFAQGMQARQRTVHYAWIGCAATLVFFSACFALVERFGAFGLIASMCISFLTMLVLLQVTSQRSMPVPYPWPRHGLMWLIAVGMVAYLYPLDVTAAGIAAKGVALAIIASLPLLFGAVKLSDIVLARDTVLGALSPRS